MLEFEDRNPEQIFRVLYEELCERPEAILRPLFGFLGEDWEPAVLEFHRHPHDNGREHGRLAGTCGFEARRDHYRSWDRDLAARCLEIARPVLERLGYG